MKRTLFLLIFYFCLTITVGKQVSAICSQLLAGKTFTTKMLAFNFDQGEAENEETDSEDTEESGEDNDDNELTSHQTLGAIERSSVTIHPTVQFFKDHLQEIGTPPPRF